MLLSVTLLAVLVTFSQDDGADFAFSDRIQVVDIEGELIESRPILDQLKRYEDSNSVKAILLNIDSPGGGVAVSQELYAEIKRLREKGHALDISEETKEFLIDKGFDSNLGARPLKRTIQRYLEDPLAEELISGHFKSGMPIHVSVKDKEYLSFTQAEKVTT